MNWVRVLNAARPVLKIVGMSISSYTSKHTRRHMILERAAKMSIKS